MIKPAENAKETTLQILKRNVFLVKGCVMDVLDKAEIAPTVLKTYLFLKTTVANFAILGMVK